MTAAVADKLPLRYSEATSLSNREVLNGIKNTSRSIATSLVVSVVLIGEADHRKLYKSVGYKSTRNWLLYECNMSSTEAFNKIRLAKAIRANPALAQAFVSGAITYSVAAAIPPLLNAYSVEFILEQVEGLTVTDANAVFRLMKGYKENPEKYSVRTRMRADHCEIIVTCSHEVLVKFLALLNCINQMQDTKYQPTPIIISQLWKLLQAYVNKVYFKREHPEEEPPTVESTDVVLWNEGATEQNTTEQDTAEQDTDLDDEEADPEEAAKKAQEMEALLRKLLPDDVSLENIFDEGFDFASTVKKTGRKYKKTKFGAPLGAEGYTAFSMLLDKGLSDLSAEEKALVPGGLLTLVVDHNGMAKTNTGLPVHIEHVANMLFNGDLRVLTNDPDWLNGLGKQQAPENQQDHAVVEEEAVEECDCTTEDAEDTCATESAANSAVPAFPGTNMYFGRKRRIASPKQIEALLAMQGYSCAAPACTHTRYLEAHHIVGWAEGGKTDINNLIMLCSRCHDHITRGEITLHEREDGALIFRYGGTVSFIVERRGIPRRNNIGGVMVHDDYSEGPRPEGCTAPPNGYTQNKTNVTYLNAAHDIDQPIEWFNGPLPAFIAEVVGPDPFLQITGRTMGDFLKDNPILPEMFCGEGNVSWVINSRYGYIEDNETMEPISLDIYREVVNKLGLDARTICTVTDPNSDVVYIAGPVTPEMRRLIARMGDGYKLGKEHTNLFERQRDAHGEQMREKDKKRSKSRSKKTDASEADEETRRYVREHASEWIQADQERQKRERAEGKKPKINRELHRKLKTLNFLDWVNLGTGPDEPVAAEELDLANFNAAEYEAWIVNRLEYMQSLNETPDPELDALIDGFREQQQMRKVKRYNENGQVIVDGKLVTSFDDFTSTDILEGEIVLDDEDTDSDAGDAAHDSEPDEDTAGD